MVKRKPVIGVITVPLSPGRKYYKVCGDGYISESHISWLKRGGASVIAIPYDTKKHEYYMKRIDGIYLPSGGVFAGNSNKYYNCCKKFVNLAMDFNENGIYFPIWGACMGMQQLMIIGDGRDNQKLLTKFDSYDNLELPLIFTKDGYNSKILEKAPNSLMDKLKTKDCTLNNHMMGLSPQKYNRCRRIKEFIKIVSISHDRKGKPFISTIEARNYPFYGVQWHPERSKTMDYFARFFVKEAKKRSNRTKVVPKSKKLFFKRINCMTYSNNIYNYCNFYWHKKTSSHNKKLCNVLNLGRPTNHCV